MGSMTDERRKEMEEEMMRFELEIAAPGDEGSTKKIKPPPAPPAALTRINDAPIVKERKLAPPPPPPPPPRIVEILPTVLKPPPPPPPPPTIGSQNKPLIPPVLQHLPPRVSNMQFIPHQVQRQPPRPPRPPSMMPMRGPPGFHGPGPMPFPSMQNSLPPPPPPQMPMPLPPMGMPMPMPPTFCPPPPGIGIGPLPPQQFMPSAPPPVTYSEPMSPSPKQDAPPAKKPKIEPATAAAPVIYAAPPTKNLADRSAENAVNGQSEPSITASASLGQHIDDFKTTKSSEDTLGSTVTTTSTSSFVSTSTTANVDVGKKEKKKKKIIRMAGGQAWEDNSLQDWEPDDFRIFCGDLGNDVTDEVLIRAFSKYQSFVRAKVIRDKRTNKTKGYGFVSFKDPQDFIKAMREMNGRYVGSRPIKLRKSTWRDRNIEVVRKKQKEKEKLGLL